MTFGVGVPKQKSCNNNNSELYPGQLDFHYDASPSWAPIWSRSIFSPFALNSLRTRFAVTSIYQPEEYFT